MVSRRPPNPVRKALPAQIPARHSPLEKTPHNAGVVGDGAMSAASAFVEMPTERGGATPRNGQQHFDMLPGDPLTASFDECVSRSADQIGHLKGWPGHLFVLWWPVFWF